MYAAKLGRSGGDLAQDQLMSAVYKTFQAFMDEQHVPRILRRKNPVDLPPLPARSRFDQMQRHQRVLRLAAPLKLDNHRFVQLAEKKSERQLQDDMYAGLLRRIVNVHRC